MYKEMSIDELSEKFVHTLVETNRGYNFYVDWRNVSGYKQFEIEFNAMNVLIKCDDMHERFIELVKKVPTVVATFPLLFALSRNERESVWKGRSELKVVNEDLEENDFYSYNFDISSLKNGISEEDIEAYYVFFEKMGLKNLFQNLLEKSVIDYVVGVLVGMDSNGRKNRGGKVFEIACEPIILKACEHYGVQLITQKKYKILRDLGFSISEDVANRKADFLLVKDGKAFNIEVDYFYRGGSKPEEIIDSYINRQNDLKKLKIGFLLITDGFCWDNKNKNQLQKGFRNLDYLLNYHLAKYGMLDEIVQEYFKS